MAHHLLFCFCRPPWWWLGEPDLTFGRPPLLAIISPTTDLFYTTDQNTLDLEGAVASLSTLTKVDWDSYHLDTQDFLGWGKATLTPTSYATVKKWHQNQIPLKAGYNEITVIAFDTWKRSTLVRLTVHQVAPSELYDEDYAQKLPTEACSEVGDPIDTATGSQRLEHSLLSLPFLDFRITYNSLLLKLGPLGRGWEDQQFGAWAEELSDGQIKLHWSTQRYNLFSPTASGDYTSLHINCQFDQLVKHPDGSLLLTRKDQSFYHFNAQGQLVKLGHRGGRNLELSYQGSQLYQVTDVLSGLFLEYHYNDQNLLTQVTDPLGRQVQFEYDAQRHLIRFTDAAGHDTFYTYNALGQILTGTDEAGHLRFSNTFDEQHRLITQEDGRTENQPLQLSYDTSRSNHRVTTVTQRDGSTKTWVHNAHFQLLQLTDELGRATTFTYDEHGQRRTATDAAGQTTTFTYTPRGQLHTLTNAAGQTTTFSYDEQDQLQEVNSVKGRLTFEYDEHHHLVKFTNPLQHVTRYSHDEVGQLLSVARPNGSRTDYEYEQGLPVRVKEGEREVTFDYDAAGRVTTVSQGSQIMTLNYDSQNRLTSLSDALGHTVSVTYNSRGQWLTLTDALGRVTQRMYDGNGNLIKHIDALGHETSYAYDNEDRLITMTDAKGQVTHLSRDEVGRVVSVTNPLGDTQTFKYDAGDRLHQYLDALGKKVQNSVYDGLGNLTEVKDALGHAMVFNYDEASQLIEKQDALKRATQFRYDHLGRLIESVDALGGTSRQEFDAGGYPTKLVDPNGNETEFEFDLQGRFVKEKVASGGAVRYTYDAQDLLRQVQNGRGQVQQLEYDVVGRLIKLVEPEGTVSYAYDANGNVLTVTDGQGTIPRNYDALNRVMSYTDVRGNRLGYEYDEVGNLVKLRYPDGKEVKYSYDGARQLVKVVDWAGRVTRYEYDGNGRLIKEVRPNGTQRSRRYDEVGRLVWEEDRDEAGEVMSRFELGHDAVGNIVKEEKLPEVESGVLPPVRMTYSAGNQLATFQGQGVRFDADGNLVWGPVKGSMGELKFDSRNRLVEAGEIRYQYDAENQRIGVDQSRYVVNSQPLLSQVLVREEGGSQTFYVYGLGLIGEEKEGRYRSYHFDVRGSTVALSDEQGEVVDRFGYGPYGELVRGNGARTPFLFNGQFGVMSDGNGLYYMRARFYSPEIKRFVNQDVVVGRVGEGQSLNRFAFVSGRPVSFVDPWGFFLVSPEEYTKILSGTRTISGTLIGWSTRFLGITVTLLLYSSSVGEGSDRILHGPSSTIEACLKFAPNDLVYGPSAFGNLRKLQQQFGGKTLTDILTAGPGNRSWIEASIDVMEDAISNGNKIHFDLTYIQEINDILKGTGKYGNTITAQELRYIRDHWDRFEDSVKFYREGMEVGTPW